MSLLNSLLFSPLFAACVLFFSSQKSPRNIKLVAIWGTLCPLLISFFLYVKFLTTHKDPTTYYFIEKIIFFDGFSYHVGLNGLSLLFVLLTTFLTTLCVIYQPPLFKLKELFICLLFLEFCLLGFFLSLDALLFFVFFEAVLIPLFLMIGIWGGEQRVAACFKFFIYTLTGSVFLLLAFLTIFSKTKTFDLTLWAHPTLDHFLSEQEEFWIFLAMLVAFLVKMASFPFHTWLPLAHVQAPTIGSVMLAGVLLKMGGYGLIRILLPLFPRGHVFFSPFLIAIGVISIVYGSFVALYQNNMKSRIAYSSIAHMGYVVMSCSCLSQTAYFAAVMQMISHGLLSSGLFFCAAMLYTRFKTYDMPSYCGVKNVMPFLNACFFILMMGAIGLPGTSGFIGEFFSFVGTYSTFPLSTVVASTGIVLGAFYMLHFYRLVFLGPFKDTRPIHDLELDERLVLVLLIGPTLILGVAPRILQTLL